MYFQNNYPNYYSYRIDMNTQPQRAMANISGGPLAPNIGGTVIFTQIPGAIQVAVEIEGLPLYQPATETSPQVGPHGFHIHENGSCSVGDPTDPFQAAGGHWNPSNQPHGNHAGDFPVLFSNNGYSRMIFFTNKFTIPQIIGKTIVIHEGPDDYKTQPAGGAGRRLACGVIQEVM